MHFVRAYRVLLVAMLASALNVHADGVNDPGADGSGGFSLEIDKSARQLLLKHGAQIARKYTVAVGRGGPGEKRIRGDNKTPEGVYYVAGFNDDSAFDIFIRLNYPNVKDGFFALQRALISRGDFDHIVDAQRQDALPPQNTPLGGAIGIHGLGDESADKLKIHANVDWTRGCIALTNREVHELRRFIDVGTRVVIRE